MYVYVVLSDHCVCFAMKIEYHNSTAGHTIKHMFAVRGFTSPTRLLSDRRKVAK